MTLGPGTGNPPVTPPGYPPGFDCGPDDDDGDGIGNLCDPDHTDYVPPGAASGDDGEDTDEDGIPDTEDNCPDTYNAGQEDDDGDGVGDACEDPAELAEVPCEEEYEGYLVDNGDGTGTTGAVRIEGGGFVHEQNVSSCVGNDRLKSTSGSGQAIYTFTGLAPGKYDIYVTWVAENGNATECCVSSVR